MKDLLAFAANSYSKVDYFPLLKNCCINNDVFIVSNDFITVCYKLNNCRFSGVFDAKTFLSSIAKIDLTSPYEVVNTDTITSFKQGCITINLAKMPLDTYVIATPEQYTTEPFTSGYIDIFDNMLPFVGIDASRAWCMGIHILGNKLFCTNNIVCVGVEAPFSSKDKFVPGVLINKIKQLKSNGFIPVNWIENDFAFGVEYNEGHIIYCRKGVEPRDLSKPLAPEQDIEWLPVTPQIRDAIHTVASITDDVYVDFNYDVIQSSREQNAGVKIQYSTDFGLGGALYHLYAKQLFDFNSHFKFGKNRCFFYKKENNIEYFSVEVKYVV